MLNLLPKSIIINNIVDTLKRDPENGILNLLETLIKNMSCPHDKSMIRQIINYFKFSPTAKMQITNLVFNTKHQTFYNFVQVLYQSFTPPFTINFLRTIKHDNLPYFSDLPLTFPLIKLKNLDEETQRNLANLKNNGKIFFVHLVVTNQNFATVTSDELILMLIKFGVRAILFELDDETVTKEDELIAKIHEIRTERPILAFNIKKTATTHSNSYQITECFQDRTFIVRLNLRQ